MRDDCIHLMDIVPALVHSLGISIGFLRMDVILRLFKVHHGSVQYKNRCRLCFYDPSPYDPAMPSYAEHCVPLVWISSLWIASDSATVALSSSQQASRSSESDELVVITVASPLQCWRRPRQRGRFGVEVVEATIGCWPCTVRCSGFGDEGDCSIQRTCYPKCHHVSIAEEGGKRRMPCRQTIAAERKKVKLHS